MSFSWGTMSTTTLVIDITTPRYPHSLGKNVPKRDFSADKKINKKGNQSIQKKIKRKKETINKEKSSFPFSIGWEVWDDVHRFELVGVKIERKRARKSLNEAKFQNERNE